MEVQVVIVVKIYHHKDARRRNESARKDVLLLGFILIYRKEVLS